MFKCWHNYMYIIYKSSAQSRYDDDDNDDDYYYQL